MGYSCTAAASYAEQAMRAILQREKGNPGGGSNTWAGFGPENTCGYFAEQGMEQDDGAITGTVYRISDDGKSCRRVGSYRVEPSGVVTRWPGTDKRMRDEATATGERRYRENHEPARFEVVT